MLIGALLRLFLACIRMAAITIIQITASTRNSIVLAYSAFF